MSPPSEGQEVRKGKTMTVAQLQKRLAAFPSEMEVCYVDSEYGIAIEVDALQVVCVRGITNDLLHTDSPKQETDREVLSLV